MIFVHVSGYFEIMDSPHKGQILGQKLDIPEALANSAIAAGASMLPEEEFAEIGFTADELAKYPNAYVQMNAPSQFHVKHAAAIQAVREYRAALGKEK